jgi:hypothetical protein
MPIAGIKEKYLLSFTYLPSPLVPTLETQRRKGKEKLALG